MDSRNRDELLRKQEQLEEYLVDHPESGLFGWYARQNMEAGELERALKICRLGLMGGKNVGLLHKLMGECYLAKGEITQAMKHFVESVLIGDPFPSAISELIKNLSGSMESEQIAYLVKQMNSALPGHPEATRFYQKYPTARTIQVSQQQVQFMENLAEALERKTKAEAAPQEPPEELDELIAQTAAQAAPTTEAPVPPPAEPPPTTPQEPTSTQASGPGATPAPTRPKPGKPAPAPAAQPEVPPVPEPVWPEAEAEPQFPDEAPLDELPVPSLPPAAKSDRKTPPAKHTITRSMATFTLMQVFKDQQMYDQALEVLELLREKSPNTDRIEAEFKEIHRLMAESGA
jgi:tetratricopeptide (TPR) repeat protein